MLRPKLLAFMLCAACSCKSDETHDAASSGGGGSLSETLTLPFAPSNLPELSLAIEADMVFSEAACGTHGQIDTDTGKVNCIDNSDGKRFSFTATTQTDPSLGVLEVAVFATRNVVIEPNVAVQVVGSRPLVILASDTARIQGMLRATPHADRHRAVAGGFSALESGQGSGLGPGGGRGGDIPSFGAGQIGAGGGAFCAPGGSGGNDNGFLGPGGAAYGTAELIPLLGGSAGGASDNTAGGAGGGAIQLGAGISIDVALTGTIHVGGAGGDYHGAGGGAGGAICSSRR